VGEISHFPGTPLREPFSGAWLWLPLTDVPHLTATLAAERPATVELVYDSVPTDPAPSTSNRIVSFSLQSRLTATPTDRLDWVREAAYRRR
jgi:hypothetical protein